MRKNPVTASANANVTVIPIRIKRIFRLIEQSFRARHWTDQAVPGVMITCHVPLNARCVHLMSTDRRKPLSKTKEILRGVVHPWYCDSFGHMNVRWYGHLFDDGAFHIWPAFWGSHQRMQAEFGVHTVTARATTEFHRELVGGDLVVIDCLLIRLGGKSATFLERMKHIDTGEIHATYEVTEVFFDPENRRAAEMPQPIRAALESMVCEEGDA
ncbi:MAG: acyl-CoA thioesterase [Proteobacteria bacterium]|nr:MAG: acyl-CoA thioesterase [Pseudomonadota bacterium]